VQVGKGEEHANISMKRKKKGFMITEKRGREGERKSAPQQKGGGGIWLGQKKKEKKRFFPIWKRERVVCHRGYWRTVV